MYYLEFRKQIMSGPATKMSLWCADKNIKFKWTFIVDEHIDGYKYTFYTGLHVPTEQDALLLKIIFNV